MLLWDGVQLLVNASVDRGAMTFTFSGRGLRPGTAYRAVLVVESGGLTAESACEGATAPAPALDLHIRHADETSLSAMWSHAPSGSRDGYFLTLRHGNNPPPWARLCAGAWVLKLCVAGNATVDTREVEANMRECTFNVLTPGRLYSITVTTNSHNLSTSVSVEGRTSVCSQLRDLHLDL